MKYISLFILILIITVPINLNYQKLPKAKLLIIGANVDAVEKDTFAEEAEYVNNALVSSMSGLYDVETKSCLRKNATYDNCIEGFEWLQSGQPSIVMVYISMHGRDESGFFFRPYGEYFTSKEIIQHLSRVYCNIILIVDTCVAGAMVRDAEKQNINIIACCDSKEKAAVWHFSKYFVEALKEADYDGNGIIYLDEIKMFIANKSRVAKWGFQTPTYSTTRINPYLVRI